MGSYVSICTTQVTRGHRQTSKLSQRLSKRMQTTLPNRKLLWHQRLYKEYIYKLCPYINYD
uniref:Uncharacterized protein n=1 Tax=Pseudonaja textilis TaxID=8673 RepID=A0A670YGS8_PSETE